MLLKKIICLHSLWSRWNSSLLTPFYCFVKSILRKDSNYNKLENQKLTIEYLQKYKQMKDFNAQALLKTHYVPKAREIILRETGFLLTENLVLQRAGALMNIDIANGVLDEFYRFSGK